MLYSNIDWLDNGNNKKAYQECERLLKKQPNFQYAKVLQSLAALRMGREEEAKSNLEVVSEDVPTEDNILQAMSIAYREMQQSKLLHALISFMD